MLDLLSRIPGIDSGVGLVSSSGSSSDLFLQLHYCSTFLKKGKRIVLISSHLNISSYRIIFSRLALRWDPDLITFIDLDGILGDNLHVDVEKIHLKLLDQRLKGSPTIKPTEESVNMSSLLIFDDVSVLERLGVESSTVLCLLNKLYVRMEADGLLLALFALKTNAFRAMSCKTDFIIHLAPIGLGFGKDVTGQEGSTTAFLLLQRRIYAALTKEERERNREARTARRVSHDASAVNSQSTQLNMYSVNS